MKTKIDDNRASCADRAHVVLLLLFFLAGSLVGRYRPTDAPLLMKVPVFLPWLLLVPALFSGNLFGVYVIPVSAMLFGADAELLLESTPLTTAAWKTAFPDLVPLLLGTPIFFLSALVGMRLSEDYLHACLNCGRMSFGMLLCRQLLLCCAAAGVLFLYRHFF